MNIRNSFHTYAIITIIFWSLAYVFTRLALQHFSASQLGLLRYFVASCVLIIVVFATKMKFPKISDAKWFVLTGATGFFLYMIVFNRGCETINVSTASVILATTPVITALLARFIYKERLKNFQWAAIAVAFSGVVILTMSRGSFTMNIGLLWLFSSALLVSVYNLLQRKLTKSYTAIQTATFSIFAGTIMLAIFLPSAIGEARSAPAIQFFYVATLGIFPSAIAYIAWSKAFSLAKNTSSVSNYMFVTPFTTTLFGFLIAGEVPDISTIIGGTIILTGLFIFNFGDKLLERR